MRRRVLTSPRPAADSSLPDARARRFADLDSWIVGAERTLRLRTWDVPTGDVQLRLLAAVSNARRQRQLAECALLAGARRSAMELSPRAQPDGPRS